MHLVNKPFASQVQRMLEKEWVAVNRLLKAVGFVPSIPDWLKLWYHALENVSAILTMQGGRRINASLLFQSTWDS
jgi:hypothetical protein